MIINLKTEEFCPDNCPRCEIEQLDCSTFGLKRKIFVCNNAVICKFAYELAKAEQQKEDGAEHD